MVHNSYRDSSHQIWNLGQKKEEKELEKGDFPSPGESALINRPSFASILFARI
jgi:hypothetical protein